MTSIANNLFIHTDMTRQYKTMQMQLENRIEVLEGMMRKLQGELGMCIGYFKDPVNCVNKKCFIVDETKQKLIEVTIERDALKKEKEEQLALLNDKLSTMEKSYESILQVSRWYNLTHIKTCGITYAVKHSVILVSPHYHMH